MTLKPREYTAIITMPTKESIMKPLCKYIDADELDAMADVMLHELFEDMVYDGDTLKDVYFDWGGKNVTLADARIAFIDTPEKGPYWVCPACKQRRTAESREEEKAASAAAREVVLGIVKNAVYLQAHTERDPDGKYAGRILTRLVAESEDGSIDIGAHLIELGMAVPYHGKTKKCWFH